MGRWYSGTISGKWAFGIMESSTPSFFHPDGRHKRCYVCPMGNEDNEDWIEFEGDDDPRIHNVPEENWTEAQRHFMTTHELCFQYERPCCGQEREDQLFYVFEEEDMPFVLERHAEVAARLPSYSLDYARLDFNDLATISEDKFGDDDEGYCHFTVDMPEFVQLWPSDENKISYYIWPYAQKYMEEFGDTIPPAPHFDREITGNPLQPVCCVCKKLSGDAKFNKKKRIMTEGEFERYWYCHNPFVFQGEEWIPGKRFTSSAPFFCSACIGNWAWDEREPKHTRTYHYIPGIRGKFRYDAMYWSFGEQLRQALTFGEVHIDSEL